MTWRWGASGVAAVALLAAVSGLKGAASLLLLAAIVAGAVRLIEAVGLAAEGRGERFAVVTAALGLVWLVAAGAAHIPLLVLGFFACVALELLSELEVRTRPVVEAVEL